MKLVWMKSGEDILVGEEDNASFGVGTLDNPMVLQYINIPQQSKVVGPNGRQAEMVTGFKFISIPCSQIIVDRVDYRGEVKKHDPVFITYYKVLEAVKKQADDPLMVAQ